MESLLKLILEQTEVCIVCTIPPIPKLIGNESAVDSLKQLNKWIMDMPQGKLANKIKMPRWPHSLNQCHLHLHACLFQRIIWEFVTLHPYFLKTMQLWMTCLCKYTEHKHINYFILILCFLLINICIFHRRDALHWNQKGMQLVLDMLQETILLI